jgi:uncharacterized protein (DUF1697 family)
MHIALLRAVNVGGRKLAMADLRAVLTEIGFTGVQSLLQSGNVVFRSSRKAGATLERALEREVEAQLGLRTDFHVRSLAEWESVIAANPFPDEARRDPAHLLVVALKVAPTPAAAAALQAAITGRERVRVDGRHAYLVYPDGVGRSRLTTALLDKHLSGRGTARNWNTVLKLATLGRG